ncbi:sigma-54 interaction domain-containing protein [Salinicoccus albus]|uniref:sigma-54 interaction domain-containing protein n=1 Tax=Salinicoccus albus TaxID=418756 RepID=UPI0003827769|nr:sigma-54-dependent Fis family transcriptional regulator [Salinicoccus albus]
MLDKAIVNELINFHNHSFTIIDKAENVIYWSERAAEIFDMSVDYVVGKKITEVFAEDKLVMLQSLRENKRIEKKQHLATKDIYVNIKSVPICIDGRVEGAIVSEVDVTEQKKQEEQIEDLKSEVNVLSDSMNQLNNGESFRNIISRSAMMERVKSRIEKAAETDATILITGDTGVGKELFAKAIHDLSKEKGDFIPINCGAIPRHLFESELFGYEKGAFTGANRSGNTGKIGLAENGTLFLDEIGEMPADMQVKFLRVLQEKQYFKLGGNKEKQAEFRLVSATNKKIADLLASDDFRADLLYRINVINIQIPPLRERPDDIESLFFYYLHRISEKYGTHPRYASRQLLSQLKNYHWPGNVRELINVVERLVIFSSEENLDFDIFEQYLTEVDAHAQHMPMPGTEDNLGLKDFVDKIEGDYISQVLTQNGHNIEQASQALGISRPTLYAKIKKFDL